MKILILTLSILLYSISSFARTSVIEEYSTRINGEVVIVAIICVDGYKWIYTRDFKGSTFNQMFEKPQAYNYYPQQPIPCYFTGESK